MPNAKKTNTQAENTDLSKAELKDSTHLRMNELLSKVLAAVYSGKLRLNSESMTTEFGPVIESVTKKATKLAGSFEGIAITGEINEVHHRVVLECFSSMKASMSVGEETFSYDGDPSKTEGATRDIVEKFKNLANFHNELFPTDKRVAVSRSQAEIPEDPLELKRPAVVTHHLKQLENFETLLASTMDFGWTTHISREFGVVYTNGKEQHRLRFEKHTFIGVCDEMEVQVTRRLDQMRAPDEPAYKLWLIPNKTDRERVTVDTSDRAKRIFDKLLG